LTEPLRSLLQVSHLLAPDDLAAIVAAHARMLGVRETVLYLADYEQATLLPLPNADVPERQELPIEGTLAGRAFRRVEVVSSASTNSYRLWMPLLDGVERLGVVEMVLPEAPSKDQRDELKSFVSLVAELVVTKDAYSDAFSLLRRRKTLSLAAEMQWELLPPLSFGTDRVVITGGLEPAYDIGGDSFDYAINGNRGRSAGHRPRWARTAGPRAPPRSRRRDGGPHRGHRERRRSTGSGHRPVLHK